MKCILILYCALSYSSFKCIKSIPVKDAVFDQYHPKSLPSFMTNNIRDNFEDKYNPGKSNVFDAVRKHYEINNPNAGDLLKYSAVNTKYVNSVIFNKAKYTENVENEILYDLYSDISTTVSYIPVADAFVDFEESPNNDEESPNNDDVNMNIEKRYLSDVMLSEIRTGNNFYKLDSGNEFNGDDDDLGKQWVSWNIDRKGSF